MEVRFEDLERDGMGEIRQIYETLALPGWALAETPIRRYLASQQSYQKNRYPQDPRIVRRINQRWRFAFDAWGYEPIEADAA